MFGSLPPARRTSAHSTISAGALAIALAVAAGLWAPSAQAQDDAKNTSRRGNAQAQTPPKTGNSPEFAKVYQPMAALVNAPAGDFAGAKAQVPDLLAAVQNGDDRNLAGNLIVVLGTKTKDPALQRQGLQLMVDSGKTPPEKLAQFRALLGGLAYDAKDYEAARTELEGAKTAGYRDENIDFQLADTYLGLNQTDQGLGALKAAIVAKRAAGGAVPDYWLKRGLQVAYDRKQIAQTNEWAALLVSTSPTPANWTTALQVVNAINAFEPQSQLDLMRLMAATNSLKARQDYVRYIEAADPRIMSNEVDRVLQSAVTAGALTTGDTYYGQVKRVVDQRTATDRTEAPKMVALARSSGKFGDALNAGDVLYSLSQYAGAEEMYQLAASKGGPDKDKALTRLGISQAQQNKTAAAKATFAQVSGDRAPVAQMWQAYLNTKA